MKVLIVGAGIGGLATALALHACGIDCEIFEQATQIGELGVGINLLPHAVARLDRLGLLGALDNSAVRTSELIYTNRMGHVIWREPRGLAAGYGVPQFSIHRGRLQSILLRAVEERLGPVIRVGHRLTEVLRCEPRVEALFERQDGQVRVEADILVGADGIHSATRRALFPGEGEARWNGVLIWRGASEWPGFLDGGTMIISGGMREKVVVYPIAMGARPQTQLLNWSLNVLAGDASGPPPRRQDWTRPGIRQELLDRLQRFSIPFLDVNALIESTAEFWEYPMCDRDALPWWSHGHVTLLGDAAHPMYPTGSNGAGQAILDADVLARCLSEERDPQRALRRYENERLPTTREIVHRNRLGGPEMMIDEVERRAPEGFDDIEAVLPLTRRKHIAREYAASAGFALDPPGNV